MPVPPPRLAGDRAAGATSGRTEYSTMGGSRRRYDGEMTGTVAIIVVDLMFQSRVRMAAEALGLATRIADSAEAADGVLAERPEIAVIDLHAAGIDAPSTVRAAKAAGARVLAFGRHTEPSILRAAREAGADAVVARSQLVEELPALLRSLLPGGTAEPA